MNRARLVCIAALSLAAVLPAKPAAAAEPVPDEVIVRFDPSATATERAEARADAGTDLAEVTSLPDVQLLEVADGESAAQAASKLDSDPLVAYAEPNWILRPGMTPTDPGYRFQWGLNNAGSFTIGGVPNLVDADVDAPEAWSRTTGEGNPVKVAIVDTGVQLDHPDLQPNLDVGSGYDFYSGDDLPADEAGHGTHVAGIAGARGGNAVGVAGVDWGAQLVPYRVCSAGIDPACSTLDVAQAFDRAGDLGIKVVNASLGTSAPPPLTLRDAIARHPGTLFVVSAGNSDADNDSALGANYPCDFGSSEPTVNAGGELPNVLCVAASTHRDERASFSNYGARSVDLAAPGLTIYSTTYDGAYGYKSGTSMASPMVAGAAALLWSAQPSASVTAVKAALLEGTDPVSWDRPIGGGRLNVDRSLALIGLQSAGAAGGSGTGTTQPPATTAPAPTAPPPSAAPGPTNPVPPVAPSPVIVPPPSPTIAAAQPPDQGLANCMTVIKVGKDGTVKLCDATNAPTAATAQALTGTLPTARTSTTKRSEPRQRPKKLRLGTGRTTISAGQTRPVGVKLTARAKKALLERGRLAAEATIVARGPGGQSVTVKRTVTLKKA